MTEQKTTASQRLAEPQAARVLLVDDHPLFRQGLAQLISDEGLTVCGEAGDAQAALKAIETHSPDIVIVDLTLEGSSGLDLIKNIHTRYEDMKILVVSMHDETLYADRALRAGAHGYVMKREAEDRVLAAIRAVLNGEIFLSEAISERLGSGESGAEGNAGRPTDELSDREFEIFQMFGHGLTPREVARQLHLSVRTIGAHRENIKRKLKLSSAAEMMRYAINWVRNERGEDAGRQA